MKRVSGVFIFVMLVATACTSAQELAPDTGTETVPAATDAGPDLQSAELSAPTDPDVMYHVFTAEQLGSDGDFVGAASAYLEAALLSDDPEIAERAARVAVSAGQWQLVVLASDRWAMLAPESLDARELATVSRLREGDYVGAEYQLAEVLELTKSDRAEGWQLVAGLLAPASDKAKAEKVLDNLLKDFDAESNLDAISAQSRLAAQFGDLRKARELIDKAIELDPERAEFYAFAGRVAVNGANAPLALKRYRQAWELEPQNPQIAMAYAELLKRNQSLPAAQAVLEQLPDTPEMRFARLVFALDAFDRKSAEALYEGFSKAKYEDLSNAAFHAAQSAELLGLKREAIKWYEQVTGERSLRAVMRQAFLYADLGETGESQKLLSQLRMQSDVDVVIQSYLSEAQILQDAGKLEESMQLLNDALAGSPDEFSLRYSRALLAVGMGLLELAENDLRLIIADHPENAAAINALGYTLADMTERYDEAEDLIFRAYALQPDDPSIMDSMGWISYRLGRLTEAEKFLREAWRKLRNAEVAAHLGEVLWARGQKDEARSLWKLGIELESDNDVLIKTMQRFGELP